MPSANWLQTHRAVNLRLTLEEYELLQARCIEERLSYADVMRIGLGLPVPVRKPPGRK